MMKKRLFYFKKIKEGRYHFDIVTPYVRYKYMTDVLYNRMIEIGIWWWRFEIHYQGGAAGRFCADLFHFIDVMMRIIYYIIIDSTKRLFRKIMGTVRVDKIDS